MSDHDDVRISDASDSEEVKKDGPIDLTGDGGVMKEILVEGSGFDNPKEGSEVKGMPMLIFIPSISKT